MHDPDVSLGIGGATKLKSFVPGLNVVEFLRSGMRMPSTFILSSFMLASDSFEVAATQKML